MAIDLRSDTVTRPSPAMRRAMAEAEVGDDVYGEDPTVRALEEAVAERFGREAAVFVPSGTMGNQIGLRLVCPPAGELVCDADAHIVSYEGGGAAQHGGIQTRTLPSPRGLLEPRSLAAQLRPAGYHLVPTAAVAVENTHNRGGGAVYPQPQLTAIRELTAARGIALHLDGARIWNAAVACDLPLGTFGALADTLSVCLSKGLGAPVGSVVVCDADREDEARALRHRLGGAMRQAGILAAAGLLALDNLERLADDHARARRLAERCGTDPASVDTNIVLVETPDAAAVAAACAEQGVLVSAFGPRLLRLVTHLDVDDDAVETASGVLAEALHRVDSGAPLASGAAAPEGLERGE